VRQPGMRVVEYPQLRSEDRPTDGLSLVRDRNWVSGNNLDVIVTSSWTENAVLRHPASVNEQHFYRRLADGVLGVYLAADLRTHFFTESLYLWADPSLDTLWTAGIGGYKVYARERAAGS
jgi:hypothetical protein